MKIKIIASRWNFLGKIFGAILGTCGAIALTGGAQEMKTVAVGNKKPNFVFILIDDLGWSDASCLGSDFYETPNIDRLRQQSMFFTDAYMASHVCAPSRASILTGKYPVRFDLNKVYSKDEPLRNQEFFEPPLNPNLSPDAVTIADILKPAGYATACIGKWHLGDNDHSPETQGFGTVYHYPPKKDPTDYKLINYLTDRSIEFLEQNKDTPFFLYLAHDAVHIPLEADPALVEKYKKKIHPGQHQYNAAYAAMLEHLDNGIGRLMDSIDRLGLGDNTIVIFTSDNGGRFGNFNYEPCTINYPLKGSKHTLYEGGIRVPLFVRWPGRVKPDSTCAERVFSNDFLPTLIEIAGVSGKSCGDTDGISFKPLLTGQGDRGEFEKRPLFWYWPCYNEGQLWGNFTAAISRPAVAVRLGDYKLIDSFGAPNEVELYNVREDIGELTNLASGMPGKVSELRSLVKKWYKNLNVKLPQPNPDFDPRFPWVRVQDLNDFKAGK